MVEKERSLLQTKITFNTKEGTQMQRIVGVQTIKYMDTCKQTQTDKHTDTQTHTQAVRNPGRV